ncbi:MAG: hypothetical protein IJS94_06855 [Clostridia bacterium]|nr:hypothetical protein [Clostridia bacterium]
MAFKIKTSLTDSTPSIEYLPGTASEAFTYGEALVFSEAGKLTKASGAVRPGYICASDVTLPSSGGIVPAAAVSGSVIYEVPLSASGTSLLCGNKVTLGSDGLTVTATLTNGTAEIVGINGTSVGDTVDVKF